MSGPASLFCERSYQYREENRILLHATERSTNTEHRKPTATEPSSTPRAPTSVATNIGRVPSLNSLIVFSLCCCILSPNAISYGCMVFATMNDPNIKAMIGDICMNRISTSLRITVD